jgi:hypothetical protein
MEIIRQITAKNRAYDVIYSCNNIPQCNVAKNYIRAYYDLYEDRIGYEDLKRILKEHMVDLLAP